MVVFISAKNVAKSDCFHCSSEVGNRLGTTWYMAEEIRNENDLRKVIC